MYEDKLCAFRCKHAYITISHLLQDSMFENADGKLHYAGNNPAVLWPVRFYMHPSVSLCMLVHAFSIVSFLHFFPHPHASSPLQGAHETRLMAQRPFPSRASPEVLFG